MTKTELTYKKLIREMGDYRFETALTPAVGKILGAEPYRVYPEGTVVFRREGKGPKLMLIAHADVPGVFVTGHTETGALRFTLTARLATAALPGTFVRFEDGTEGVIEKADPAKEAASGDKDMLIVIGAATREEAEQIAPLGAFGVFAEPTEPSADGRALFTPYAEGLAGVAALMEAYKRTQNVFCPNDTYFVFTADGENEHAGVVAASRDIDPDISIAVCGVYLTDIPGQGRHEGLKLHSGATVIVRAGNYYSPCVYEPVLAMAKEAGIPVVPLLSKYDDTEAGNAIEVGSGSVGCAIGISLGGFGTHRQMFSTQDAENAAELLKTVITGGIIPYSRRVK